MKPTLVGPDLLYITPYRGGKLRRGDIIVFQVPGSDRKVTHRVMSADTNGIRTRGDANRKVDPYLLQPNDIIGSVHYVHRGNRRRRIYGGIIGQLSALTGRANLLRVVDKRVSALFHPTYHRLSSTGAFRRLLPRRLNPRVFSFKRPEGTELQLVLGRFPVGRRPAGRKQWEIRRPFRLILDLKSLPQ